MCPELIAGTPILELDVIEVIDRGLSYSPKAFPRLLAEVLRMIHECYDFDDVLQASSCGIKIRDHKAKENRLPIWCSLSVLECWITKIVDLQCPFMLTTQYLNKS